MAMIKVCDCCRKELDRSDVFEYTLSIIDTKRDRVTKEYDLCADCFKMMKAKIKED